MVKSGSDTAESFPVEPRRIMSAGRTRPPERTLEAGRAKIRLWNGRGYRGRGSERQEPCTVESASRRFQSARRQITRGLALVADAGCLETITRNKHVYLSRRAATSRNYAASASLR